MNSAIAHPGPLPTDPMLPQQSAIQSRSTPTEAVEIPLTPSSDAERELEQHIASLAALSEKAMRDGDPTGAKLWSRRMVEAIAQRSPQQLARMERVIDEGLDYFSSTGAVHRRMNAARGLGTNNPLGFGIDETE